MSHAHPTTSSAAPSDAQLEQATKWFLRLRSESARADDLPALKAWIDSDPLNKLAYQQVTASWTALGQFSSAPEVMIGRRDALDDARRAARRRWSARRGTPRYIALAASVVVAVVGALGWVYSQRGVHATDLGERRALTLEDGSVVTLDASSRVRVQYEQDRRTISLERGQARFDVARDPVRPFRVRAGNQTVIALGTQFNVELVAGNVLVSMIEGHVAVTGVDSAVGSAAVPRTQPTPSSSASKPEGLATTQGANTERLKTSATEPQRLTSLIELKAGEGLRVRADGHAIILPSIDVGRAIAWQSGKMFFDNEPLENAAERINRYSQLRIVVDPSVANVSVSGVFNAGDPNAFVEAISTYFAVRVDRVGASKVHLTARN